MRGYKPLKSKTKREMMKKFILITLFATFAYSKLNIVVSIPPQATFVKEIGKDKVDLTIMVNIGNSPHIYEPKPSQMKNIAKAKIYFSIGVEFEKSNLPKFINQNRNMKIIDSSLGIERISISKNQSSGKKDPHIWTTPKNVKIIAKNILKALIEIDNENRDFYQKNYKILLKKIDVTDENIKNILKNSSNKRFMVFHPSWGYFAKEYNLIQLPIEIAGKKPKPKEIIELMKTARKQNIKTILTAPEFSDKIAKQIANELKINVFGISPLNPNWSQNLENLAKEIAIK